MKFFPPYIPGQMGQIEVTVSVEDPQKPPVLGEEPLPERVVRDWLSDGWWDMQDDHMVQQFVISPASWGLARTQTYTLNFMVPADPIGWHTQDPTPGKFMNVRARVSYYDPLAGPRCRRTEAKWKTIGSSTSSRCSTSGSGT